MGHPEQINSSGRVSQLRSCAQLSWLELVEKAVVKADNILIDTKPGLNSETAAIENEALGVTGRDTTVTLDMSKDEKLKAVLWIF